MNRLAHRTRAALGASRLASASLVAALAIAACAKPPAKPAPVPTRAPAAQPGTPTPGAPGTPTPNGGQGVPPGLAGLLGGAPGGDPTPRPYATVITPGTKSKPGLFTTHQRSGRLYFEIPSKQLSTDMVIVRSLHGTPNALPLFGTLGGSRLVRWERRDNRIFLRATNYTNVVSDTTNAIRKNVEIIQLSPIIAAFNVEAFGKDSAPVIEVTRLFTGGVPDLMQGFGAFGPSRPVDATRSFIEKVGTYDKNVEVEATQTYGASPVPGLSIPGLTTGGAQTEGYHYSIVRLPDVPMKPRFHDERVGYFSTTQNDFGSNEQRVAKREFITRWRLECSDQREGNLCAPKKPITYYVDPSTPNWLKPYIRKGVEEWQPAFAAAGFKNGIIAKDAPTNDPDFSGDDASVSMVKWIPSDVPNSVGPSIIDPRSGEIIDADVQMLHQIMDLQRSWYFTQVGHLDPRVQKLPMPDSLMGQLVQFVVAHEVGHTLGFPHNMKSSSMYPLDSIRSKSWVAKMGHSPSVMDYARFNYVAQPEDHIPLNDLIPRVGPYDVFATKWGYAPLPSAATPEAEKPTLNTWARMQDTVPWFRFADDGSLNEADAGEAREAVGDAEPVRATALGMKNLKRVALLLEPATTSTNGDTYDDLQELHGAIIGQWAQELSNLARVPGSERRQAKVVGQSGVVWTSVPRSEQKAAVELLQEEAFRTPRFLLNSTVLRKYESQGALNRVGNAQRRVLDVLLDNQRMQRMIEIEALAPDRSSVYTLGDMLGDVRRGLWSEIYAGKPIDAFRRRLQRSYIESLGSKINPQPTTLPPGFPAQLAGLLQAQSAPDARALLQGDLITLDRELANAIGRTSDQTTKAHLQYSRTQIDKILHPKS